MKIESSTIDDILNNVLKRLIKKTKSFRHSKGTAKEQIGALLILTQPNARLSRSESRATLFSCLGETLWYLDGSSSLDRISYYISGYRDKIGLDAATRHAPGAYGPRIFGSGDGNQFERIYQLLSDPKRKETRKAVIQVYDKSDLIIHLNNGESGNDVPCTVSLQFFVRSNKLHLMSHMRSNDAFLGLPHDIFAFTFLQEIMARRIGIGLGNYIHSVGSLHLYEEHEDKAREYLSEGYQDQIPMPTMPSGNPNASLTWLMNQEERLRLGANEIKDHESHDPYWRDLARLLLLKRLHKDKNAPQMSGVIHQIEIDYFRSLASDQQNRMPNSVTDQISFPL